MESSSITVTSSFLGSESASESISGHGCGDESTDTESSQPVVSLMSKLKAPPVSEFNRKTEKEKIYSCFL